MIPIAVNNFNGRVVVRIVEVATSNKVCVQLIRTIECFEPSAMNELIGDVIALLVDYIDLSVAALHDIDMLAFDVVVVEVVVPHVRIRVHFYLKVVGVDQIVFASCGVDHLKSEEVGAVRATCALLRLRLKIAQFLRVR